MYAYVFTMQKNSLESTLQKKEKKEKEKEDKQKSREISLGKLKLKSLEAPLQELLIRKVS